MNDVRTRTVVCCYRVHQT